MAEQKYSHAKAGVSASGRKDASQRGIKFVHVEGYVRYEYEIEQETNCPCDWLPFPHLHSRLWRKISLQRFRMGGPPLSRDEYERYLQDGV
jgi:hypothetical protein